MYSLASVTVAAMDRQPLQAHIDHWLLSTEVLPHSKRAIWLEHLFVPVQAPTDVVIQRSNAGCACCIGQVVMRAQLVRLLRAERPDHLLLLMANAEHIEKLSDQLRADLFGWGVEKVHLLRPMV